MRTIFLMNPFIVFSPQMAAQRLNSRRAARGPAEGWASARASPLNRGPISAARHARPESGPTALQELPAPVQTVVRSRARFSFGSPCRPPSTRTPLPHGEVQSAAGGAALLGRPADDGAGSGGAGERGSAAPGA